VPDVVVDVTGGLPLLSGLDELGVDDVEPDPALDVDNAELDPALGADDADPDPALVAELDPKPKEADPVEDAPELSAPPPGRPVIDGPTVTVAVGYIVVVMAVLVIMVVGPLKIIVLPSPNISICVGPGR
jgi:hypothetical protein